MATSYNAFDPEAVDDQYVAVGPESGTGLRNLPGCLLRLALRRRAACATQRRPSLRVEWPRPQAKPNPLTIWHSSNSIRRSTRRCGPTIHHCSQPTWVKSLEPMVRAVCAELVDQFIDRGSADIVADFGAPIPSLVICRLVGFPDRDALAYRSYCDDFVAAVADPGEQYTDAVETHANGSKRMCENGLSSGVE